MTDTPATLSDVVRVLRLLLASFAPDMMPQGFIEAASIEVAAHRPSRLRLSAAMRRLRSSFEEVPTVADIIEAVRDVDAEEIAQAAAVAAAWHGRGDNVAP
jgi:hypothetical protein